MAARESPAPYTGSFLRFGDKVTRLLSDAATATIALGSLPVIPAPPPTGPTALYNGHYQEAVKAFEAIAATAPPPLAKELKHQVR